MDNRRIGLFDSGLGGLTVMKELMRLLPGESIVYFGDTGRIPYGSKSVETVIKYTKSDINFLNTFDLKLIVAACGTASSTALPHIAGDYDVPVMGVIEPAAQAAVRATKNGKIGVIGTTGTIRSEAYRRHIATIDNSIVTAAKSCPLFVHLVESGFADSEVAYLTAKEYLAPICEAGVDTLILGCTHYPLLKNVITKVVGEDVTLIDPGVCAAEEIKAYLEKNDALAGEVKEQQYKFFVSDNPAGFVKTGSAFLERELEGFVQRVDIEQYTI